MTDTQLKHDQPNLSDDEAELARLAEAFEMARHLKIVQCSLKEADGEELNELIAGVGLPEEIERAAKDTRGTFLDILSRLSEQALEAGRDKGFLSPDDYLEALKAKRTLSLSRDRATERENGREA